MLIQELPTRSSHKQSIELRIRFVHYYTSYCSHHFAIILLLSLYYNHHTETMIMQSLTQIKHPDSRFGESRAQWGSQKRFPAQEQCNTNRRPLFIHLRGANNSKSTSQLDVPQHNGTKLSKAERTAISTIIFVATMAKVAEPEQRFL